MTKDQLIAAIRNMQIPERAKVLLEKVCDISGRLVEAIINFVRRHPGLEIVALAFAASYFLQNIPILGMLLSGAIIFMACIVALLEELKHVLASNKE